ncbi:MAG TPA: hypothetical protein VM846_16490 [Vicinamibacterales bacterium]|jgi:hypothetical protein|nr:hypothetical protein [Vicinamibacterales bacterium]
MKRIVVATSLIVIGLAAAISADTLVLTNGRRIQGELLGVFGREIEFEERSGAGRRIVRIPRNEIARIEFVEEFGSRNDGNRNDVNRNDVSRNDDLLAIPRGMRERQVSVSAREGWADTGIEVRNGQQIYIQSSGEVRWGPNRRDGAAGERNSPFNANRPLPDRPAAALIGRIGERDVFFIGADQGPFRMRGNGRLFLGINDDVLDDNSGTLRVIVSY